VPSFEQIFRFVTVIRDLFFNLAIRIQPHDLEVMQYMLIHGPVFYPDQRGEFLRGGFAPGQQMPVAPVNFPADTVLLPGWGVSFFGSRLTIMKSICNFCWSAAVWMAFNFEKVVVT